MDVPMPDADRKRARDEAGSAEAGAGLPIDTQAGFTMLGMRKTKKKTSNGRNRWACFFIFEYGTLHLYMCMYM